jgi:ABC-type lipoprotein export system ATPase subunit
MKTSDFVISTHSLTKTYSIDRAEVEVLKDITLAVAKGEFVALCGPSGSGKTTLLNLISGIDRPTSGKVFALGEDLTVQDEDFLAEFRCSHVGFVFQSYNLVSTLTVTENIAFPME